MNQTPLTEPAAGDAAKSNVLRRRTIIGAAAWAAPVIVSSVASPAYAASEKLVLSMTAPDEAKVGTLPAGAVYATVLINGSPAEGVSVSFTVVTAAHGGFGPNGEQTVTAVTDAAGIARPPALLLKEATIVTVLATTADQTAGAHIIVTEVAASGTMAFHQNSLNVAAGSTFSLAGTLTRTAGTGYPAQVRLVYPTGFSGPATAPVDQTTGGFLVPGITAGTVNGTITASATGFGNATVHISPTLGYISTMQGRYAAGKGLPAPKGTYVIPGKVNRVAPGAALPATVTIAWINGDPMHTYENATGFTNGQTVPVNQTTGEFTLPTLTPIDNGRGVEGMPGTGMSGQIEISSPDYMPARIGLSNSPSLSDASQSDHMSTVPAVIVFAPGETRDVAGFAQGKNELCEVRLPEGFTGPATVTTDDDFGYTIRGVTSPSYITQGKIGLVHSGTNLTASVGMAIVL